MTINAMTLSIITIGIPTQISADVSSPGLLSSLCILTPVITVSPGATLKYFLTVTNHGDITCITRPHSLYLTQFGLPWLLQTAPWSAL